MRGALLARHQVDCTPLVACDVAGAPSMAVRAPRRRRGAEPAGQAARTLPPVSASGARDHDASPTGPPYEVHALVPCQPRYCTLAGVVPTVCMASMSTTLSSTGFKSTATRAPPAVHHACTACESTASHSPPAVPTASAASTRVASTSAASMRTASPSAVSTTPPGTASTRMASKGAAASATKVV